MKLIDKYLIYSSVFAIFTESFNFNYFIDWKLFYLILIFNLFVFSIKYITVIHKNLIFLIVFLIFHGVITFIIFSNPIQSLIAQILGISVSSLFYYNLIKKFGSLKLINIYLKLSIVIAVLAIPMFYLDINTFTYNRLNGIMSEPAHYAAIMLPAVYLFLRRKNYFKLLIILLTIFMSKSSVGFYRVIINFINTIAKGKIFFKVFCCSFNCNYN